jgi:AcrR family transcriptional regulator
MIKEQVEVDTRTRILDIARDLITTQGYGSTSIADIAEKLGTSKAALYYHFKSKEEILDAILAEPLAALSELTDRAAADEPGKHAEEVLAAMIDFVAGPSSCLASFEKDPSVLHQWAQRNNLLDKEKILITSLVGPKPDATKIIRARAALAVVKQGTAAVRASGDGKLRKDERAEILAAAVRALG